MPAALDKNTMKDAQKAETKLRRMRKASDRAVRQAESKWNAKVDAYIEGLPVEVRAVLRAGGVLEHEAPEPADEADEG